MKIKDIMTTEVVTADPNMSIANVSDSLYNNRFHGMPVAENGKVIGIITEDDFFLKNYDDLYLPAYIKFIQGNKVAGDLPDDLKEKIEKMLRVKARDLMTPNCVTVTPDTEVPALMELMKKTKFTTFPVTDRVQNLLGVVTLSDVLGTVKNGSQEMAKAYQGEMKNAEVEKLAQELDTLWKDKLILMSKTRIRTWKGLTVIAAFALIGAIIIIAAVLSTRTSSTPDNKTVYPLGCQKFTYSEWGECREDGTQTREVTDKLPKNCEGGFPETVRNCQ